MPGFLKERTGCIMDFATELLSCLRSIQRRSIMRIRSPRSIPTYKLRFQPQPSARGSEVEATRNFLGAGMGSGSNPASPATSRNALLSQWDLLRVVPRCAQSVTEQTCGECVHGPEAVQHPPEKKWRKSQRSRALPPFSCHTPRTEPASQFIMSGGRGREMPSTPLAAFSAL
ncbi:unnamed protein product [Pleuronectes platessa]|uniref:Uncharacterized protein n=1 Tax=Pleuronectes platessa TaxID=8262 RepID=A0A9N7V3F3_PLEPL|nr:unnamed protein product [Pleuronectes platessa]